MRNMDVLKESLVNGAGWVVIGMTVLLFTLCMAVSIMTLWSSEGHPERRLFACNTQEHTERVGVAPRITC